MLDPDDRLLLLDALRPPAGFAFNRAVGTSFTLDLHALLTTPLALAAFDWEAADGSIPDDPVALLESLRRCSNRIDFFCQAGEIGIPPAYHRLYAWLEHSVHEATPRSGWAVFHPKIWLLRYRPTTEEGPSAYRLLCASRNLTFDRNWDVLLVLDGAPTEAGANGGAVAQFIARLPSLAVHTLRPDRRRELSALAGEVAGVRFSPPEQFDDLAFHFLGEGGGTWPLPERADRLLVVSPFVTGDAVERLLQIAPQVSVVSRAEELDRLPAELLERFAARHVLSPAAVPSSELADDQEAARPLVGLHAKLYVAELGSIATWFSGSANATTAGFGGNVEALVEMRGPKSKVGIDTVLADTEGGLLRLLQDHPLPASQTEPTEEEELRRSLDDLRRSLAASRFTVTVVPTTEARYDLIARSGPLPTLAEGSATTILRPLSLPTGVRVPPDTPVEVRFGPAGLESITPFLVIEVVARRKGTVVHDAFVVRADLIDEPSDRADHLLASLLASRSDVLRYLLFLLADAGGPPPGGWFADLQRAVDRGASTAGDGTLALPLLETLVRTVARDPAKLTGVHRLVEALGRTEEGRKLLPEGFAEVWPVIWEASGRGATT